MDNSFIIPWIATLKDKKELFRFFPGIPFEIIRIILEYCEHFPDINQLMSVLEVFDTEASLLFNYHNLNIDRTALGYWLENDTLISELDLSNLSPSIVMTGSILGDLEARGIGKALTKNTTLTILDTRGNLAMSGVGTMKMATAIIRSLTMKSFNGICIRKFQENSVGTELILRNKRVGDSGAFLVALHIAPHMLQIGDRIFVARKSKEEINVGDVIYPKIYDKTRRKNKKNIISGTVEGIKKKNIALVRFGSKKNGNLCHYSIGEIALKRYPARIISINNNNTLDICFESGLIRRSFPFENMINRDLTNLDLSGNDITNSGIRALSLSLEHNDTLIIFTLKMNLISDEGAYDLSEMLKRNTTLTRLDLCSNQISYCGAGSLAKSMHTNSTLEWLHLGYNTISDDGAISLARSLKINQSLSSLDISKNNITNCGMIAIAESLKNNATLTYLNLSINDVGDNGIIPLGEALKRNTTLTNLILSRNKLSDDGMCALGEALKKNKGLKVLDMSMNNIDGACLTVLEDALNINNTLIDLKLLGNKIVCNINSNTGSSPENNIRSNTRESSSRNTENRFQGSIESIRCSIESPSIDSNEISSDSSQTSPYSLRSGGSPLSIGTNSETFESQSIESRSIESRSIESQSNESSENNIGSDSESSIENTSRNKIANNESNSKNIPLNIEHKNFRRSNGRNWGPMGELGEDQP